MVKEKLKEFVDETQKAQDSFEDAVAIKMDRLKTKWKKGEDIAEEQEHNEIFTSVLFVVLAIGLVYFRHGGLILRSIYMGLAGLCITVSLWCIVNFVNNLKS